ncbi:hypothetical protein C8Q79DRAFT_445665 [Trametes meyenii]|nr:hypothetical protein C8Q79DRAFT_445665 [Trametes meyenii]
MSSPLGSLRMASRSLASPLRGRVTLPLVILCLWWSSEFSYCAGFLRIIFNEFGYWKRMSFRARVHSIDCVDLDVDVCIPMAHRPVASFGQNTRKRHLPSSVVGTVTHRNVLCVY